MAPARTCAFDVVRRVFEQGAFADRALHSEAAGLDRRDRALAMQLAYGTIQRRATLDYVAERLSSRAPGTLDPPVLAALRLGLFQLLFLGGVADHAVVNDSVELAKLDAHGGAGLVNAVLRRAAGEGRALLERLDDGQPAQAAILHSVPEWLARRWFEELGDDDARALLRRVNEPAESALRVNTLVSSPAEISASLLLSTRPAPRMPEGLVLESPFDSHGSALFKEGAIMPQSRGSMLVSRILAPQPEERVLDLCAAPGAKSTHLAALMGDRGAVVAVERHPGRARALERTSRRMHASCVEVAVADATEARSEAPYHRVLVDPPCSGLGTLQSRPDLRWRVTEQTIAELATLQRRILEVAGAATAPGGVLVYSVCTISRDEGVVAVERFLRARPEFHPIDLQLEYPEWRDPSAERYLQLLPHRDRTDGFFVAKLQRG